jgi:DNA-binding NarL/FixJ family response regulator
MKVLIADDSDLIRERLQQMLSKTRQVEIVGSYSNGFETIEGIRLLKPDLAIIDIKMPWRTGLEILKEIREDKIDIIIILLTFYSSDFYRKQAIQYGADYFFSKVDDFEKISMVVEKILKKIS